MDRQKSAAQIRKSEPAIGIKGESVIADEETAPRQSIALHFFV